METTVLRTETPMRSANNPPRPPRRPARAALAATVVGAYVLDLKLSMTRRIAHFLDWAAVNRPKEFIPYNEILKNVQGYRTLPRLANKEIDVVKSAMSRVRKVLHEEYNRGLLSSPGSGVRATTDDLDRAKNELTKRARDVVRTSTKFNEVHASIDASKLPTTGTDAAWKVWVKGGAKELASQFTDPNFAKRLLPPGSGEGPK
jgi:hypothetical protein